MLKTSLYQLVLTLINFVDAFPMILTYALIFKYEQTRPTYRKLKD